MKRLEIPVESSQKNASLDAADEQAEVRGCSDPNNGHVNLAEYYEKQWLPNRGKGINTRANYRSQWNAPKHGVKVTWGHYEVRDIRPQGVRDWVARMVADGMTPATIEARFGLLQTILAARRGASALRDELIVSNPCRGVELPSRVRRRATFYDPGQVEKLLNAMGDWWVPLAMLDAETGLRWGELIGLRVRDFGLDWKDVEVNNVIVEVPSAQTGNGTRFIEASYLKEGSNDEPKRVSLSAEAQALVHQVVRSRALSRDDFLFSMPNKAGTDVMFLKPTMGKQVGAVEDPAEWVPMRTRVWPDGLPISRNYFRQDVWSAAVAEAGLPYRRFHALHASHTPQLP